MFSTARSGRRFNLFLLLSVLALSGCEHNLFSSLYDRGDSNDPKILLSDANAALREGSYDQALTLFNRVLAQDSTNSDALYGAAVSEMAAAGLDFGTLLNNVLTQSAHVSGVSDLIAQARRGFTASDASVGSIVEGLPLNTIDDAIDRVICRLTLIASDRASGDINSSNLVALLDLATLHLIRAVVRAVKSGYFDVVNTGGQYQFVDKTNGGLAAFCSDSTHQALIEDTGRDAVEAYAVFNKAVDLRGLSSDAIITRLRDDVGNVMDNMLTTGLPASCLSVLSGVGITQSSFRGDTEAFNPPASSCQ